METLIGELDRISELPDFIAHRILSFLDSPAQLVRMSVVSKTWFNLTASFPFLDFNIYRFRFGFVGLESFFKFVDYTTSRFCHQNLTAHTFKLIATIQEPAELDVVNRCLHLILQKGVRELLIDFTDSSDDVPKYRLPDTLLSVSVLQSLTLYGCDLPSSLMLDAVKFKSLIHLELENVHIDDEMIKYLTTTCLLLQVFFLISCHGFKSFCVYGHQNLEDICIYYDTPVETIDIEAPNLSNLEVADKAGRGPPQMNLASCKRLTNVTYIGNPLPNSNGFTNFLSNFPFVQNFCLATMYKFNNLKLSSHSLRTLMLYSFCDFEEIEINTPNLDSLSYPCDPRLLLPLADKRWPLVSESTHLKACLRCYPDGPVDDLWFQKLRLFLDKKSGFKVLNLYIHALNSPNFAELEKLKAIELSPYELDHVELQLESHEESLGDIAFVDAVLWCCRPRSLTLRSSFPLTDFEEQSDVVMFTYDKLLQQEDQGLTNIQIVSPSSSFLMALSGEGKAIRFIKEEVPQEEADSQRFAGLEIC